MCCWFRQSDALAESGYATPQITAQNCPQGPFKTQQISLQMSQRISLLIHDRSRDSAKKSKQINNFTRNTGGGNNHGCELETTSDFFEASFCLIFCCFHVVLDVDAVKLQIPVLQKTMSPTANDHRLCVPITNAERQWCFKIPLFSYYIWKYIGK